MSHCLSVLWVSLMAGLAFVGEEDSPKLSRVELAKRGKEASAFLEVGPGQSATAFCVSPAGLFVSNAHAFQNQMQGSQIKIVMNSGTLEQKVFAAKVVRRDVESDLALLRVESKEDLPFLQLGSVGDLEELLELVTFGFPFGRQHMNVPGGGDQYPSISVNAGAITSLKRKNGEIHRIQLNVLVNPGNSGGPLLNARGRVMGVILGRIEANVGAGIDVAIPVNLVERFLARPEVNLTADRSESIGENAEVELKARVTSLLGSNGPLDMKLVLGAGTPDELRVPLKKSGETYLAKFIPFPASKQPRLVDLEVAFPDGSVRGLTSDGPILVGANSMDWSRLEFVRFGSKSEVLTADGHKLTDIVSPPKEMTISVGGQKLKLETSRAISIRNFNPGGSDAVDATLLLKLPDQEVVCGSLPLFKTGASRPTFVALREGRFVRPTPSAYPVSYLKVESTEGDWIGQGKSYSYQKEDLNFQAVNYGGIRCQVANNGNWSLELNGGRGQVLQAMEYRGAKRSPFAEKSPGIEFSGNGRGSNQISGEFRIWEIEFEGNTLRRIAVDFVQRSEGRMPPLLGMLRYNSRFH